MAALAVGLLRLLAPAPKPAPTWQLGDGSTVRLVKVTYGTNHVYNYGHRLRDWLYPVVPAKYRTNFNFQVTRVSTPYPGSLVVWFEGTGGQVNPGAGTPSLNFSAAPTPASLAQAQVLAQTRFYVSIFDDSGVESTPVIATRRLVATNNLVIYSATVRNYPRRSKLLNVIISDSSTSRNLVTKLQIPNPAPQNPANWTPENLPASRKTNDLEITLVSLETGVTLPVGTTTSSSAISRLSSVRGNVEFKINGQPTFDWSITSATLLNAAGESDRTQYLPSMNNRFAVPLRLAFPIWSEEPAWKLRLELARTSGFGPGETWTNEGVAIPLSGQNLPLQGPTNLLVPGIPFSSVGSAQLPNVRIVDARPSLEEYFSLNIPDGFWITVLWVKDDLGRFARESGSGMSEVRGSNPPSRLRTFHYSMNEGAKTVDVVAGVSRIYTVEFTVKPTKPWSVTASRMRLAAGSSCRILTPLPECIFNRSAAFTPLQCSHPPTQASLCVPGIRSLKRPKRRAPRARPRSWAHLTFLQFEKGRDGALHWHSVKELVLEAAFFDAALVGSRSASRIVFWRGAARFGWCGRPDCPGTGGGVWARPGLRRLRALSSVSAG